MTSWEGWLGLAFVGLALVGLWLVDRCLRLARELLDALLEAHRTAPVKRLYYRDDYTITAPDWATITSLDFDDGSEPGERPAAAPPQPQSK